jgi:hypothetical protein
LALKPPHSIAATKCTQRVWSATQASVGADADVVDAEDVKVATKPLLLSSSVTQRVLLAIPANAG